MNDMPGRLSFQRDAVSVSVHGAAQDNSGTPTRKHIFIRIAHKEGLGRSAV